MENKIYWKEAATLLKILTSTNVSCEISQDLKDEIISKILGSIKMQNYLVTKLMIYSIISKEILLDFLLYNALNKEKTYDLFRENPSKYCNTYMFNILTDDLPNIKQIFSALEVSDLENKLNIMDMLIEIGNCNISKLKELFPRAIHFSLMNPYSQQLY